MTTAPSKPRTGKQAGRNPRNRQEPASLEFRVDEVNGGGFHWSIIGEHGESLARSGGFASREEAERAARRVHDCAGSARLQAHVADERLLAVT